MFNLNNNNNKYIIDRVLNSKFWLYFKVIWWVDWQVDDQYKESIVTYKVLQLIINIYESRKYLKNEMKCMLI